MYRALNCLHLNYCAHAVTECCCLYNFDGEIILLAKHKLRSASCSIALYLLIRHYPILHARYLIVVWFS